MQKRFPHLLPHIPDNEEAVFDQMVSLWAGRLTGKLKGGNPDVSISLAGKLPYSGTKSFDQHMSMRTDRIAVKPNPHEVFAASRDNSTASLPLSEASV